MPPGLPISAFDHDDLLKVMAADSLGSESSKILHKFLLWSMLTEGYTGKENMIIKLARPIIA